MRSNLVLDKVEEFTGKVMPRKDILLLNDRLLEMWYAGGESDLSFYESEDYVWCGYLCYQSFSRKYVQQVYSVLEKERIRSILDVGAGIGATTKLCLDLFDGSHAYYQNLPGRQFDFAKSLLIDCADRMTFVARVAEVREEVDLVFCLELFEHIKEPLVLLQEVLELNPQYIVTSNSFSIKGLGHYSQFTVFDEQIGARHMNAIFKEYMVASGFCVDPRSQHPLFWNGRPRIWKR